jgi:hypothetical protein
MARSKKLIFPIGGVNRQFGFQSQPPYTAADASNVRSAGAETGRVRGGSRPGLTRAFVDQLGSDPVTGTIQSVTYLEDTQMTRLVATTPVFAAWMVGMSVTCTVPNPDTVYPIAECENGSTILVTGDASGETGAFTIPFGQPINCMGSVRPVSGTAGSTWCDTFETIPSGYAIDSGNTRWLALAGYASKPTALEADSRIYATSASGAKGAAAQVLAIDTTKPYTVRFVVKENSGTFGAVTLCLRMDNAAPAHDAAAAAFVTYEFDLPYNWCSWTAKSAGTTHASGSLSTGSPRIELSATIDGDTITLYMNNDLLGSFTAPNPAAGTRVGIIIGANTRIDEFAVDYSDSGGASIDSTKSYLLAASGGTLYIENDAGGLDAVTGDVNLDADSLIDAVESGGKIYFADYATAKFYETGCAISATGAGGAGVGRVLDKANIDWSTVDADNDLCWIKNTGTSATAQAGCYAIAAVDAGGANLTLANAMTAIDETALTVRIARAPKVYDPVAGTLTIWNQTITGGEPLGIMPLGCPLIAPYRGRIVLGGADDNPHVWYMSRIGDLQDWYYGADPDDPARAIAGTSTDMGKIAQPLTALVSYSKDYLLFGCKSELWVLRGDPGYGGVLDNLSYGIGIIGKRAWCHLPNGAVAFLSHRGLYVIDPAAGMEPTALSENVLPQELKGIDTSLYIPLLGYDGENIHIYLTPTTQGKTVLSTAHHWIYDMKRGAFWPVSLYGAHEPLTLFNYEMANVAGKTLLLGCRDGCIRRYSDDASTDDTATIDSNVLLGPFTDGMGEFEVILHTLEGILSSNSGNVTWELYSGDSAEAARDDYVAGTEDTSGTFAAGRSTTFRPRRRGAAFYLNLVGASRWEMDTILAGFKAKAVHR